MKIAVIGTGYVGLVAGACLAESGNDVICVDKDQSKVRTLRRGRMPFYEPGLEELVRRNRQEGRLTFTPTLPKAVRDSAIIFIAVGTPPGEDGSADVQQVLGVAREIALAMNGYKVIVAKSTVPVGTSQKIRETIRRHEGRFRIAYSLSGLVIEQFEKYAPEVLDSFREVAGTLQWQVSMSMSAGSSRSSTSTRIKPPSLTAET